MKIPFNREWVVLEREDYANYLFVTSTWEGYSGSLPKKWGFLPGSFLSAEYIDSACNLFILKENLDKLNKEHFKMLFTAPEKWEKLHQFTIRSAEQMFKLGKQIRKIKARKLNNRQLLQWLNKFIQAQIAVHDPRGPMWFLETPDNIISDYLYKYLEEKKEHHSPSLPPQDAFQILSAPLQKSIWSQEKEELLKIATIADKKSRQEALKKHAKKYEWLEYGLQGKILDIDHFEKELGVINEKGWVRMNQQLKKEQEELKVNKKKIEKEYNIDPTHLRIFKIVSSDLHTRLLSKDSQFFGYYCIEGLLKELAKRGYLTLEQTRYLAPVDYERILLKGEDLSTLASERKRYSIHFADKGKTAYFSGSEAKAVHGKLKFYVEKKNTQESEDILKGQTAFKGQVRGRIKIINTMPEMAKMHEGNILVSHMTNPSIVPAMKKAAGIITDLGGITCHAAIIARELKVPCVIGTKIATQVLRDGEEVEIDADKGEVKRIV